MERLTGRFNGNYLFKLPPVKDKKAQDEFIEALAKKIGEYEDLEEQGLLVKLPCKVGDTVYYIDDGEIYWDKVYSIDLRKEKGEFVFCIGCMDYKEDDFGKIAFTSKEEAEKALAEMEK